MTLGSSVTGGLNAFLNLTASGLTVANPISIRYLQTGGKTVSGTFASGTSTYSGNVTLADHVTLNAAAGGTLIFSGVIAPLAGGTLSGTPGAGNIVNTAPTGGFSTSGPGVIINDTTNTGIVEYDNAMTYLGDTVVNQGTLQFNGAGSLANSSIRLGNTGFGAANLNMISSTGSTLNVTVNVRPSSGIKTISASNTSGTSTLGGHIALDDSATITEASATGTLAITQARLGGTSTLTGTDIKGFTLTLNPTGIINLSGDIYSSTGVGSIIKTGSGTATFSGVNTYTGATTVTAGTLQAGVTSVANVSGAFGNNSAVTMANVAGATLNITGFNTQIGSLTGGGTTGGNVVLGAATLTVGGDNSSPAAYAGIISGSGGSLNKIGSGKLILNGANTYSGGTTLAAGTITLGVSSTGTGVSVTNGAVGTGTLTFSGGTLQMNNKTLGNNINVLTGTSSTIDEITNNGTINGNATGSGTLTLANTSATNLSLVVGSTGTPNWSGFTGTINATTTNGVDNIIWTGAGTWDLSNATVNITNTAGLNNSSFANINTGQTVKIGALIGTAAANLSGNSNGNYEIGNLNTSTTFAGTIGGANGTTFSISKVGTGTLTLTHSNNYTGGTTISAGAISIAADNNLGNGGTVTLNGGTLMTTANITNAHVFNIGANGGTINVAFGTSISQYYFNTTNALTGSGTLTLTGTGTLTQGLGNLRVDHTNTYNGNMVVQSGGIFEYGINGAVDSTATFTIGNQGELSVQNNTVLPNNITVSGGTNSVLSFENGNGGNFTGAITLNANVIVGLRDWYNYANVRSGTISGNIIGTGSLTLSSSSGGVLTLTGTNSYSGSTTIAANTTLQLGNGGYTGVLSTSSAIVNNGTLAFDHSDTVVQGTDFSGAALTSGALTQFGSGTTTLNAANTYSGATTISAGSLQFNGTSAMSSNSALNLNGGTLALRSNTSATFTPASASLSGTSGISVDQISGINTGNTLTLAALDFGFGGQLNVTAANGYILKINAITAEGSGQSETFNVASGAILQIGTITANSVYNFPIFSGAGTTNVTGAITQAAANRSIALTFNQTGTVTLSGNSNLRNNSNASDNVNTFVNLNSGTVNFNNNNAIFSNFAAPLNINGTVTIDNTSGGAVVLAGAHAISIGSDFTYGGTNNLDLGNNGTTLNGAAGSRTITTNGSATLTLSGSISNGSATGLTKAGPASLLLSDGNSYTGGTTVTGGKLINDLGGSGGATGNITPFGSGSVLVNSGATLQLGQDPGSHNNTAFTIANTLTLNGGTVYEEDGIIHLSGDLTIGASGATLGSTYNIGSGDGNKGLFIDGVVSGSANMTLQHSGINTGNNYNTSMVYFTNAANTYSGTVTVTPMTTGVNGGSFLGLNASTALQFATVNLGGNNAGTTSNIFGTSPLVFNLGLGSATLGALSGSGNVILTDYNETTHVQGGGSIALTVGGNNASTTYSGIMSGGGNLTKTGTGAFTLTGSNTYTGGTTINNGTLVVGVAGVGSIASSAVTVNSGGTLQGSGTTGTVLINSGGTISPGNSPGKINTGAAKLGRRRQLSLAGQHRR